MAWNQIQIKNHIQASELLTKIINQSFQYIEINPNKIKHLNENIKLTYSKTFTKINCLKYTNYDKIFY